MAGGALSEPGPYNALWLAGGKDAAAGPTRKGETRVLERGKPSLTSPTCRPQLVPLKCLLLWGAGVGFHLCPTQRLLQGWRDQRAGEGSGAVWGVTVARGCPLPPCSMPGAGSQGEHGAVGCVGM